jgi:hypothetical protein
MNILNLVGFEVLTAVFMKSSAFWTITPYSPLKAFRPASCWFLAWHALRPWIWRQHSSETSLDFHWTAQHYIPEDRTPHSELCAILGIFDRPFNRELQCKFLTICFDVLIGNSIYRTGKKACLFWEREREKCWGKAVVLLQKNEILMLTLFLLAK